MLTIESIHEFQLATERHWAGKRLEPGVYGYQIQSGTRWLPGLSEKQITSLEATFGVRLPDDHRRLLRIINGTDKPTINIFASMGCPPEYSVGVYSYPRDVEVVQQRINDLELERAAVYAGLDLQPDTKLFPIFAHRYIACTSDPSISAVYSIMGDDAICFGEDLKSYLEGEFRFCLD